MSKEVGKKITLQGSCLVEEEPENEAFEHKIPSRRFQKTPPEERASPINEEDLHLI